MDLRIFLTADVHLGMKFAGYPEVQGELSEARFSTFASLVERANAEGCALFVVAGDLFDRTSVSKETIARAARSLGEFQGKLAAVLPGNHDYLAHASRSLWTEFAERIGDSTLLLAEKHPYPLQHYGLDAVLYPAPCDAKHSGRSAIGWVKTEAREKWGDGGLRIGVAHGSLKGLSPGLDEERYFPMSREELLSCGLDLWLLGHVHSRYPDRPDLPDRVFYPGTPEPDGFDCAHDGSAWILTVKDDRSVESLPLATGKYRFLHHRASLGSSGDVENLKAAFASPEGARTLCKLSLAGRLSRDLFRGVSRLEEEIRKKIFYLHSPIDTEALREEIKKEDIEREFSEDSFPYRLLGSLADEGDHEALQIAYEMILEAKK
jgi:DNA repair exonuclease SbcCD nuclease subunit